MAANRRHVGHAVCALGALALLIDLWQPWYRFSFTGALLDRLESMSSHFGPLGDAVRAGASLLRGLGPIGLSAWKVFEGMDVALCLAAVIALLVSGGALLLTRRILAVDEGGAAAAVGAVAMALVVYRLADPPGPGGLLTLDRGAWIGLASAGAMLAGGLLAWGGGRTAPARPAPELPLTPEEFDRRWATAASVPPPPPPAAG